MAAGEGQELTTYYVYDLNDLIIGGSAPTLTDATGIFEWNPANEIMIAANGFEAGLGGYSVFAPGDPHAYVLTGPVPTGIGPEPLLPDRFALYQNVPNPFNPTTTISFRLSKRTEVRLSIYTVDGRLVTTLVDDTLGEGHQKVSWDGRDSRGNPVSSGVYFYRLTAGGRTLTKKMVLLQ